MADTANVQSIEALVDFRAALVRFLDEARNALNDADFELNRTTDWLANDRRLYWASEVRKRDREVADARATLHRKELGKFQGSRPDTYQEEKDLRIAKERLEEAIDKVERVKRWLPELEHASHDYRTCARPLADTLDGDMIKALAKLERMIIALEEYVRMQAPRPREEAPSPFARTAPAAAESVARPEPQTTAPAITETNPTENETEADDERDGGGE